MKNQTYIYSTFLAAILLFGCSKTSTKKSTIPSTAIVNDETSEQLSEVVDNEGNAITVTGYIDVPPENRATISPYFGGFVKRINVLPGQSIKKEEILFILENPDYLKVQQDYLESKEQLEYLQADYERQKMLADEKITSTKKFKKAESDYKAMLARYQSKKEQLKLMGLPIADIENGKLYSSISIKSPISGSITKVNITKGAFADAMKIAVEIVNLDHIHLELEVFEKDALAIKEGQKIQFEIPEIGSLVYQGEVHLVGKSIDPQKRTIRIHGHIKPEIEGLIPGMFVEAKIEIALE